jgi:hypothetical protein
VVLQQADRLEHARESPASPTAREQQRQDQPQGTRGHSQKQVERRGEVPEGRGRRLPSDKATPAQMSVILLKLREEVYRVRVCVVYVYCIILRMVGLKLFTVHVTYTVRRYTSFLLIM